MLEVVALIYICRRIWSNAFERGRSPIFYIILTLVIWVGMEILGFIIGLSLGLGAGAYFIALVFAVIGGLISYILTVNF